MLFQNSNQEKYTPSKLEKDFEEYTQWQRKQDLEGSFWSSFKSLWVDDDQEENQSDDQTKNKKINRKKVI